MFFHNYIKGRLPIRAERRGAQVPLGLDPHARVAVATCRPLNIDVLELGLVELLGLAERGQLWCGEHCDGPAAGF